MRLKGKNIIVTGAGRGIGKIIAEKIAEEGGNLFLIARTKDDLRNVHDEITEKFGVAVGYEVCDVSDSARLKKAIDNAIEKFGQIHSLINNAGVQRPIGEIHFNSLDEWNTNIAINLMGCVNAIHALAPHMIMMKHGCIINISGGGSTSPRPNFSAYSVAKTGIVRLTEVVAEEYLPYGISVNAISPGAINTAMLDEVIVSGKHAGNELESGKRRKESGGDDPNHAAELICFLASDESKGITGKLISAIWDDWRNESFRNLLRSDKDFATLRRIDNKHFYKK